MLGEVSIEYPGVDEAEHAVLAVASGEWDENRTAASRRPLVAAPFPSDRSTSLSRRCAAAHPDRGGREGQAAEETDGLTYSM